MNETVQIRKYAPNDRQFIRDLAWETAFQGEPADIFFASKEILGDILTKYFTDYEPESCFVAVASNRIIGFIIGSKNHKRRHTIVSLIIAPLIAIKILFTGALFKFKNIQFLFHVIKSFVRGEFFYPSFYKDYPAIFHINIVKQFRAGGLGSLLIQRFEHYLKEQSIMGIQLSTMSEKATHFFQKNGYIVVFKMSRTYFSYIGESTIHIWTLGKKL